MSNPDYSHWPEKAKKFYAQELKWVSDRRAVAIGLPTKCKELPMTHEEGKFHLDNVIKLINDTIDDFKD